jgi:hypothetical protein
MPPKTVWDGLGNWIGGVMIERPSGSQTLVSLLLLLLRADFSPATAAKAHARTATTKTSFFMYFLLSFGEYYSISTECG